MSRGGAYVGKWGVGAATKTVASKRMSGILGKRCDALIFVQLGTRAEAVRDCKGAGSAAAVGLGGAVHVPWFARLHAK